MGTENIFWVAANVTDFTTVIAANSETNVGKTAIAETTENV